MTRQAGHTPREWARLIRQHEMKGENLCARNESLFYERGARERAREKRRMGMGNGGRGGGCARESAAGRKVGKRE